VTFKPFDTDAHTVRRDFASWRLAMLELIVTVTYTIGFLYLVPKVVAEFRRSRSQHHGPVLDKPRQDIEA
jgi:hypothetical protein